MPPKRKGVGFKEKQKQLSKKNTPSKSVDSTEEYEIETYTHSLTSATQSSNSLQSTINRLASHLKRDVNSEVKTPEKFKQTVNRLVTPLKINSPRKTNSATAQRKHALSPNDPPTNPKQTKRQVNK